MTRIYTQTHGVVAALIERKGKFILVKEGMQNKLDYGKWNHPAGWLEVGEDPLSAIKREVKEETGFDFQPKYLLGVYSLVKKYKMVTHHPVKLVFLGKINQKNKGKLSQDVLETKWFSAEEICRMDNTTLRDSDIKKMIKDYQAGQKYPLKILTHTVTKCAE